MTFIAGFYATDGIVLVSDSRGAYPDGSYTDDGKKIFKFNEKVGMAISGDARVNASIIQDYKEFYRLENKRIDENNKIIAEENERPNANKRPFIIKRSELSFLKGCLSATIKEYYNRTHLISDAFYVKNFGLEVIVGGYAEDMPFLIAVEYRGNQTNIVESFFDDSDGGHMAIGGTIQSQIQWSKYFRDRYKELKPIKDVITIAKKGLMKLVKEYNTIGLPLQVATIRLGDGLKFLSKDDIKKY